MDTKPIRRRARQVASMAAIAGAVLFAAPTVASAAVHPDGIQGSGHNAIQPTGIQGTGHNAVKPAGIQGTGKK